MFDADTSSLRSKGFEQERRNPETLHRVEDRESYFCRRFEIRASVTTLTSMGLPDSDDLSCAFGDNGNGTVLVNVEEPFEERRANVGKRAEETTVTTFSRESSEERDESSPVVGNESPQVDRRPVDQHGIAVGNRWGRGCLRSSKRYVRHVRTAIGSNGVERGIDSSRGLPPR